MLHLAVGGLLLVIAGLALSSSLSLRRVLATRAFIEGNWKLAPLRRVLGRERTLRMATAVAKLLIPVGMVMSGVLGILAMLVLLGIITSLEWRLPAGPP